jgi:hypothetical protein
MQLRKTVTLREQREYLLRIADVARCAKGLCGVGHWILVAEHKYRQTLVRFIESGNHIGSWARKPDAFDVEPHRTHGVAGKQAFDRYTVRTYEALTGMRRVNKAWLE